MSDSIIGLKPNRCIMFVSSSNNQGHMGFNSACYAEQCIKCQEPTIKIEKLLYSPVTVFLKQLNLILLAIKQVHKSRMKISGAQKNYAALQYRS